MDIDNKPIAMPQNNSYSVAMTDSTKRGRGRPAEFPDRLSVPRLPRGGADRLKAVLRDGEGPGEFMRNTLMAQIEHREMAGEGDGETRFHALAVVADSSKAVDVLDRLDAADGDKKDVDTQDGPRCG